MNASPIRNPIRSPISSAIRSAFSSGFGGPANSATAWYFGANGLAGAPWANVRRTGTATFVNSSGLKALLPDLGGGQFAARIDYDPVTLASQGLLIERAATNEINSHSLASPQMVTQTVTVTAAQRTISFYGTGTITLSGAHAAVVTGTGAYPTRTSLTFTPSAAPLVMTVTGTVQYPQLETGSVATSYIPNAGAGTAVRVADDWFLSGGAFTAAFPGGTSEATVVFEFDRKYSVSSTEYLLHVGPGTYGTGGISVQTSSGNSLIAEDMNGSFIYVGEISNVTTNIVALSWNVSTGKYSCALNGSGGSEASSATMTNLIRLLLGHLGGAAGIISARYISARTLPGYFTGAALQALTA
jgi:hypothetical protein